MKVLILIFFIVISTSTYAQRIGAAVIAGMTASQVSGDQLSGFDKAGLMGGLAAFTPLSARWIIQVELLYVQKGSSSDVDPDAIDLSVYKMKLNYAEVPVMVEYVQNKLRFEAGAAVGFLLSSREEDENGELEFNRPFKKLDFSLNGGIGYQVINKLFLFTRLSNSIIPIRDFLPGYNPYFLNKGQYNTVIEFTLRYKFKDVQELRVQE